MSIRKLPEMKNMNTTCTCPHIHSSFIGNIIQDSSRRGFRLKKIVIIIRININISIKQLTILQCDMIFKDGIPVNKKNNL